MDSSNPIPPRGHERGYSLVEVMLASALLSSILVSISTLFVIGTQSVRSGRELTKAASIANGALEEALSWHYDKVWRMTGGASTTETLSWSTKTANPTYSGTADDQADCAATANAWRSNVEAQLKDGYLTYRVEGMANFPSGITDGLEVYPEADFLKVTITVFWTEGKGRTRHVQFEGITL